MGLYVNYTTGIKLTFGGAQTDYYYGRFYYHQPVNGYDTWTLNFRGLHSGDYSIAMNTNYTNPTAVLTLTTEYI